MQDSHGKTDEDGNPSGGCCQSCSEDLVNKFIAVFVILVQIAAYIVMTTFLKNSGDEADASRRENCYGENCDTDIDDCMDFATGGLTSILLVVCNEIKIDSLE